MSSELRRRTTAEYERVVAEIETSKAAELEKFRQGFEEMGITPGGWAKMRISEKRAWLIRNLPKPENKASGKSATMPKDPNWRARSEKAWRIPFLAGRRIAFDPSPMTRQVERQKACRSERMPIGMGQPEWHKLLKAAKGRACAA